MSADDPLGLVGQTLDGRYLLERVIGRGGMGIVYAARHSVIERPLVVKVLRREATRDPAAARRFVQEVKAATRIGHPNIVDVTDFGTTGDGLTYSVMELVDGPTLANAIRDGAPFTPDRAVRVASQIARALAAAHDKGVVHRDLKPDNVFLVDRDGRPDFVKIGDFGIAKMQTFEGADRLTNLGTVIGTPEYMAPEQAAGNPDTDHRVDIYALGTILYEMLVGRVPHKGGSTVRTIAMQITERITPPSAAGRRGLPRALEAVVMRALAKNRDERFQTMHELFAALDGLGDLAMSQEPEPATPRSLHELGGRAARWPIALAGVALASAVIAVIVVVRHRGNRPVAALPRDAAPAPADAHVIAMEPTRVTPLPDAAVVASLPPPDAAIAAAAHPHPASVTIEVIAQPGEAEVYVDGHHRGPSGVHVEEPYDRRVTIECKAPHLFGRTQVVFDGKVSAVYCAATRIPMCVEGLKNPYDVCEEPDPTAPVIKPAP